MIIFQGNAHIAISEASLWRRLPAATPSYTPDGFDGAVTLLDLRTQPLHSGPAQLLLAVTETAVLQFTLQDTEETNPAYTLSLTTGPRDAPTPRHPLFMQIAPLTTNRFATLALASHQEM